MNMLEKILEEIENEAMTNKEIGIKQCEGMARAMNIIRSHIDEINDCGNCIRRKWYQKGYEDGKSANVKSNDDWIPIKLWETTETDGDGIDKKKYQLLDCHMPDDGDEILVTLKDGTVSEDICFFNNGEYYPVSGHDWVNDVIAWMPKPKGYKGE